MKYIRRNMSVRLITAMLVAVAVIILSTLAAHAPAQNQSSLALKNIRTDKTATFYAKSGPDCAWFREGVLSTSDSKLAGSSPDCAWFREGVLSTSDSKLMPENLQSVAAAL
jgi:hypothetical protein